jgi:hypothetical protein
VEEVMSGGGYEGGGVEKGRSRGDIQPWQYDRTLKGFKTIAPGDLSAEGGIPGLMCEQIPTLKGLNICRTIDMII